MPFEEFEKPPEMEYKEKEEVEEMEKKESADIERMENLDFLGTQDRMNLILTYLGEKPTSEIEIVYDSKKPLAELQEVLSRKEDLERNLNAFGLRFKILEREKTDEDGFDRKEFQFLVGKEEKNLGELEKALLAKDDKKIGKLFGYPETAVEAFSKGWDKILDEKEWWQELSEKERNDLLQEGVLNFRNFALSKEYWREELETVRKWQSIIKEKAPKLYQEMIKEKPLVAMTEEEKKQWEKEEAEKELRMIREKIDKITDRLGMPIEEGIKETVVMLNAFGLRTSQSCEGHIDRKPIGGPSVLIKPKEPEVKEWYEDEKLREKMEKQRIYFKRKMVNLLNIFYQKRKVSWDVRLGLRDIAYGFTLENNGSALLEVLEEKEKQKKFQRYKKEMADFTQFLKENYPKHLLYRSLEI
jgi:hypothetical protein